MAPNADEVESRILDGGYTIKTFGSTQFYERLVAIQCEIIPEHRLDPQKTKTRTICKCYGRMYLEFC
jgi:hypothetical protein